MRDDKSTTIHLDKSTNSRLSNKLTRRTEKSEDYFLKSNDFSVGFESSKQSKQSK